ncbi:hypothetical protein, partial [uncultured Nostoc sp.]|uniref:hypothetical protein n=1 Tax=uncultured Nostoc sp. TaxID=340711 RepID=UPI0035CC3CB2
MNHIYRKGTALLCPYRMVYLPENSCNILQGFYFGERICYFGERICYFGERICYFGERICYFGERICYFGE